MNRYFKEVLDAHELISSWLGNTEADDDICVNLLSHFSPLYTMVTPGGMVLDFNGLKSFFLSQRGARQGLNIKIHDMQVIVEDTSGATVVYKEEQQLAGQDATLRFSTVVFELSDDDHVIWRHLHETFLLHT
ncbi:DUF4440 domain-containing protein [Pantoea piersonii]|jgi:hypothetical protein|uniref:DUF4440 domain-containing protein n=1 Tax=Pantoea piersonii TaxID=2364647 RepID=UPI000EA2E38C|nr:DUF4440 domain-containing protein [Pantoea piersonii]MBZ6386769.1 DUF4440 domain-containing protein [Pantoea piersonii]MBZ6400082.1 DUF4440 domain-containing protein [Pantoea piersonii]MBZ6410084.1 DUF4440 domain-containing protein [Pantoea piersonii]MBZ6426133.1 DUF4440 domain-containing protein [Pantoea piersonii]NYB04640.1 DUF4440 domain-containing protein [Pantoea piersonii]